MSRQAPASSWAQLASSELTVTHTSVRFAMSLDPLILALSCEWFCLRVGLDGGERPANVASRPGLSVMEGVMKGVG